MNMLTSGSSQAPARAREDVAGFPVEDRDGLVACGVSAYDMFAAPQASCGPLVTLRTLHGHGHGLGWTLCKLLWRVQLGPTQIVGQVVEGSPPPPSSPLHPQHTHPHVLSGWQAP